MKRNAKTRSLRRRILIVTEDTVSSNKYVEQVRVDFRLPEANVAVIPGHGSDPVSVVETAVKILRENGPFDRVFVVIDRDSHANFSEAMQKLRQYNINAKSGSRRIRKWISPDREETIDRFEKVLSVPCFEFWILLHFIYQRSAFLATGDKSMCDVVISELRTASRYPQYQKGDRNLWDETKARYEDFARPNAIKTRQDVERTQRSNPSTNFYIVIDELLRMRREAEAS